ncbi:unnamed protein product [Owenia fusiformis]|uniref:Uncharacterized protein n=1 Tax=Owenia fusiformis TaxID=6347 RepID=A0A8J1Y230_OWEFU|nr:unnamed protein product [Owenia fusiformis]
MRVRETTCINRVGVRAYIERVNPCTGRLRMIGHDMQTLASQVVGFLMFLQVCTPVTSKTLKVTTIHEPPFVEKQLVNGRYTGFIPDLLDELKDRLGINFDISIVKDGAYGVPKSDGKWTGMIGEVLGPDADFAAAPLTITSTRLNVLDFTLPFMTTGTVILGKNPLEIKSVGELANQNTAKYGTIQNGLTKQFFQNSTYGLYARMWAKMNSDPSVFVDKAATGVDRVRQGNYYFIMDSVMADYWSKHRPCDVKVIGNPLNSWGYGLAFSKGSPHVSTFNLAILRMQEDGTLSRLRNLWWKDYCSSASTIAASSFLISSVIVLIHSFIHL